MMSNITTIGLDIAKSVFQVHAVDSAGEVVVRRKLTRGRVSSPSSRACRDAWSEPATAARRRSDGGHPPCRAERDQAALACATDGSANDQVAAVALANKTARMVGALMIGGERYREPAIT